MTVASSRIAALRQNPVALLMVMAAINYVGFASWSALLNNFAKESVAFSGRDMGLLQSIREIPGFLAFTAAAWILIMREQTLAYASLVVLGVGIALTGYFPTIIGLWMTTFIMSVGFHYYETMAQSLTLQIVPKAQAPRVLGRIGSAQAISQLSAFGVIMLAWTLFNPSYEALFLVSGLVVVCAGVATALFFPRFNGPVVQRKGLVLRQRYWLYYALTFMVGARRQIFMAFGGFLLVEKFGFGVSKMALLLLITYAINTIAAPRLGGAIARFGERRTVMFENISLIIVFLGYAVTDNPVLAAFFFITDGVFFTLTIAQRTYFQKIADPADIAPTAGVAFTINHIAAVFIPAVFGFIWLWNPSAVFAIGCGIASVSLLLAFLIPDDPAPGNETTFEARGNAVQPAQ